MYVRKKTSPLTKKTSVQIVRGERDGKDVRQKIVQHIGSETQVVFALITTAEGLPITYKVFPGNTHEVKTLLPSLNELRQEFDVERVEFSADRGMFCEENLKLLEQAGTSSHLSPH